jgi:hypothetical protein
MEFRRKQFADVSGLGFSVKRKKSRLLWKCMARIPKISKT